MTQLPRSAGLHFPDALNPVVTRTTRMFYLDPAEDNRPGWYLQVRGGRIFGPFGDRTEAQRVLDRLINRYVSANDTGGRD